MMSRRPFLMGAAASGLLGGVAHAQSAADFMGEWHGALDLGSQRLRLRLVVSPGPSAVLYSVDQGNSAIPVGTTRIEGAQLMLSLPVINASFRGVLLGGRIEGQFTQGGALPLVFTREEVAATAPPAEPLTQARLAQLRTQAGAPAFAAAAANLNGRGIAFADGLRAIGQNAAVTTSDKWHLGSITKSMTATLVARAVEAGGVSWNDTVHSVLGGAIADMRAEYRDVTFRHLLSHRAGLQGNIEIPQLIGFPRESADARADRIAYARLALLQTPVGPKEQSFEYSNNGYVIAGAMLEAKLGAPWENLIQQHVFNPLGMASAGQGAPGTPGAYDQPCGHAPGPTTVRNGQASTPLIPAPPGAPITDNPAALGPAGRVHANLEDVLKYLRAHCERSAFLRTESWDALHTPPFGGPYAMGWSERNGALWHNGSNTLWYAEVMFDRSRGVVAAAATNDGRAGDMGAPIGTALMGAAAAVA
ncbi:serine hydrolase domain-containing protein [Vitreimonas sp.]|uniref:serine hydrolase domain-containing protein n=1 Tax=Vitreimonas sp. TaxID=3069702 RepID=UPI002EDB08A8